MQLAALQKAAAQAIVNIFETGSIRGNYGDVTLLRGDSGQLTYGRSQTTLASGNLFLLMKDYSARADGAYAASCVPYLPALEGCDTALNNNMEFRGLLKDAGDDPVMHEVQDAFFDRVYWEPAIRSADALGVQTALGAAIVYDSTVHGSWAHMRERTRQKFGELSAIGEKVWLGHYLDTRYEWLATHSNALLHKTVYRMDALATLIRAGNWNLKLPFTVRGLTISTDSLGQATPIRVPAESAPRRMLRYKTPPQNGPDVIWLQERLARAGIRVTASGVFDAVTDAGVRAFQENHDLKVDGIVGPVTRSALEDIAVTSATKSALADQPMPAVANPDARPARSSAPPVPVSDTPAPAPPRRPPPEPAQPPPAPRPARSVPPPPAESQQGDDAVDDIKRHVTTEVKSGVETVRKSLRDEHEKLTQRLSSSIQNEVSDVLAGVKDHLQARGQAVLKDVTHGRPLVPAVLSGLTLAFTEARDFFSWNQAASSTPPTQLPTATAPSTVQTTIDQTTAAPPANDTLAQAYAYLHNFAASVPNEWIFRLRIGAVALIAYAIFRLWRRRVAAAAQAKQRASS